MVTQKTFNPTGTLNTATAIAPLPFGGTGTTSFNYDAAGRVGSVVNPVGQRDSVQYDVLNRPTWTRSRDSAVTTQSYGDAARIDTVVDALTQRYIAIRDRLGRDSVHVDPRGNSERWFYDTLGNVSQYTNRRGQSVFFTYDPLGRVKRRIAGTDTANFDYDPSSNAAGGPANGWVAARNAFALDTTWLDDHGRPATSVTRRSGHRLALWYAFDQLTAGRKTVMWSDTTGAGATIYNNFDGSFRLSAIIPWSGDSSSFSYSAASQLQRITLPTSSSS